MKLIRSFPAIPPPGRAYVVDDAERLVNSNYSYRGLVDYADDVIHLDWDQAVDLPDLKRFARRCQRWPDLARVVPVKITRAARPAMSEDYIWNARVYTPGGGLRYITRTDRTADLFGFGMVYLPGAVLKEFEAMFRDDLDSGTVRFDDTGFSGWYSKTYGPAEIDWDIPCVHLHYSIREAV